MPRLVACLMVSWSLWSNVAEAFCGFYVAGGGAELFNNATQVVLMRNGTRTVLSMQNDYQGPPQDFAMVIPVPVVLQKENVKTLPKSVFQKLDTLSSPRLVEYWEQDPCPAPFNGLAHGLAVGGLGAMGTGSGGAGFGARAASVRVEAQFEVGEYEIVILSAEDALGLEVWLKEKGYRIPEGAAPLFRPYIQQGQKFFVAKVNVKKVAIVKGRAALSPLRFHYDAETFALPVRLGLINSKDTQDLIVHVLAKGQRYEVANLPNVTIPTNIDLVPSAKSEFGPFYASLFDKTQAKRPGSVVTEYAWDAQSCDPCPIPALNQTELTLLGLDVIDPATTYVEPEIEVKNLDRLSAQQRALLERQLQQVKRQLQAQLSRPNSASGFVITRLHARYTKATLGEDLVFRAAGPIEGGREFNTDGTGLERGAKPGGTNNFQARYAIRYPWTGNVACKAPQWGIWGGPPNDTGGLEAMPGATPTTSVGATAFVARDRPLERFAESPITELAVKGQKAAPGVSLRAKK